MGKFINTKYQNTVDNIIKASTDKLDNPYYIYNGEKPTPLIYYNINQKLSTVDKSTGYMNKDIGDNSGFRYNKIYNLIGYGVPRIEVDLERTDWGVQSSSIEGSFKIPPNTIVPCPNDFFMIKYLEQPILFKILNVTIDTIPNGVNFYKVDYKLDKLTNIDIEKQVVDEYETMTENSGTNYNTIIKKTDYITIEKLECILGLLKTYYKTLFYRDRVQSFILYDNGYYLYDPSLIEFIIRNKLINDGEEYLYITQQISLPESFSLDYSRTLFNFIESKKDIKMIDKYYIYSQPEYIDDMFSILRSRPEDYYKVIYKPYTENITSGIFNNIDIKLIDNIKNKKYYDNTDNNYYRNIIIDYCNKNTIDKSVIDTIDTIEFIPSKQLFYEIPILIYILEDYIKTLLALTSQ